MIELNLRIANNPAWGAFSHIGNYACVSYTLDDSSEGSLGDVSTLTSSMLSLALKGVTNLHSTHMAIRKENGGKFNLLDSEHILYTSLVEYYKTIGEKVTIPFVNAVFDLYVYRFWTMQVKLKNHPKLFDGTKSKYVSIGVYTDVVKELTMDTILSYYCMFIPYRTTDCMLNSTTCLLPYVMDKEVIAFTPVDDVYSDLYSAYGLPAKVFVTAHREGAHHHPYFTFAWKFSFDEMAELGRLCPKSGVDVGINVFLYRKHHSVVF